jgi:HlyD family type I secretion membrane fusion protein
MPDAPRISSNHLPPAIFGLATIGAVFLGLGTWAAFARLDSAVIAPGIITVETNRKTVQHLEGGIVDEIFVRDTQIVAAGDVLLRLRPVQAEASQETQANALDAALALEARLTSEQEARSSIAFPAELAARASRPMTRRVMDDQLRQFDERRQSLANQIGILRNRIEQMQSQVAGHGANLASTEQSLASLRAEYQRIQPLAAAGRFPVNRAAEMDRRIAETNGRLGQLVADIARTRQTIAETELQIVQTETKFKEEIAQSIREVRMQVAEVREKLRVTKDILARIDVRAPADGMIQNLKVHTIGGVVRAGEPILEIAPASDLFNIQVKVAPLDINHVTKGQDAEVRFPGFKDRTIPLIVGKVRERYLDSTRDEQTREPYFLAIVEVREAALPAQLRGKLTAGMPAEVMIATGERTALDYFVGPLLNQIRSAGREK